MKIKINNVEKTRVEWMMEFNLLGREQFKETYGIEDRRELIHAIREARLNPEA